MRFSIIIVSWNALQHLQEFLQSVIETDYPDFEIIIADNASTDGSADWIREHYPDVKITTLDQNYGYCGGNNRAVPIATGDVLVFLNNDVKVAPNWLKGLEKCFNSDEKIAAVQPKMLSYKEPEYFEYAGAAGGFLDKYGYPFCRGRIFDTVEKDEHQYETTEDILWASGAALAIRKEQFEWQGGFDEDFEFHMEEIDLCWRLWNHGYRVIYCPSSEVYHLGGGSLPMGSPRKVYYNFRNNLMLLWKNYSSETLIKRFSVRYLLDIIAAVNTLLTFNFGEFGAIVKAHYHFLGLWRKTHAKRKQLNASRTNPDNPSTVKPINLIWNYFFKRKKYYRDLETRQKI